MKQVFALLTAFFFVFQMSALGQSQVAQAPLPSIPFTYQGKLNLNGLPADGDHDFVIQIYDSLDGGTLLGENIANNVPVSVGIFTIPLNFATETFQATDSVFLDLQVRPSGSGEYTRLGPRLRVGSAPYANISQASHLLDCTNCVYDGQIISIDGSKVTGTVANAVTAGNVSGVVGINHGGTGSTTQNFVDLSTNQSITGIKTFSGLAGNGSSLTNLTPANITPGVAPIVASNPGQAASGTTPTVANLSFLKLNYSALTTITDFTGGVDGQCVTLLGNPNVKIVPNTALFINSNWQPDGGDTLTLCQSGGRWYEKSRSANAHYTLSVALANGVASSVSATGISCGSTCSNLYASGAAVTLTAAPGPGEELVSWSGGGCSGDSLTCTVTMSSTTAITATFGPQRFRVSFTLSNGFFSIPSIFSMASNPLGLSCSIGRLNGNNAPPVYSCTASSKFAPGTTITFAEPFSGATSRWSSNYDTCSGYGRCTFTVTNDTSISTVVGSGTRRQVSISNGGNSTVTGLGINCPPLCSVNTPGGYPLKLTSNPAPGLSLLSWTPNGNTYVFSGWAQGEPTCEYGASSDSTMTVVYGIGLNVSRSGTGNGTVTAGDGSINCGTQCSTVWGASPPATVTLSATVGSGSVFGGWSGDCTGTSLTCVVVPSQTRNVTANFGPSSARLFVEKVGNGVGTITGSGINCGPTCTTSLGFNSTIVLTASPGSGSLFQGWNGAGCELSEDNHCTVTMNQSQLVQAAFSSGGSRPEPQVQRARW